MRLCRQSLILFLALAGFGGIILAQEPVSRSSINAGYLTQDMQVQVWIDQHMQTQIRERGLSQVTTVLSSERSIELPARSVHMVFTSDAYHHFEYYQDMLASIKTALVSGGEFIVVEFDIGTTQGQRMTSHVGGSKHDFTRQIEDAGFVLVEDFTLANMEQTFMRRFRKP